MGSEIFTEQDIPTNIMADQIRINYGSMSRPDIDKIVERAIEEDRPVVLQTPPEFHFDDESDGLISSYFEGAEEAAATDFENLRGALEREDIPVTIFDLPDSHEGSEVQERAAEYWNLWDVLTIFASLILFILSIPIQYLLRFAYRTTGHAVFSALEDTLVDAVWINPSVRNYLRHSRHFDEERLRETIATVRNDTGKEPIVVTSRDLTL